ncbi:MAG TPA: DUF4926 domain-containing protein [Planctomycetota bacterium]|nr:DUF4926 domain-containing protein [Planctomycetota bacterium]
MTFHVLDTVMLLKDLPQSGLQRGDLGAIVDVRGAEDVDVEFVSVSGEIRAIVTLRQD